MSLGLDSVSITMREDLRRELEAAWARLGKPGASMTAKERVGVAAEARHATKCSYCATCREAVSPFGVEGEHERFGALSESQVELIHRLINDQGRLTKTWHEGLIDAGLSVETYVETIGIIAVLRAVDTFHRGIGLPAPKLPAPEPGDPTGEFSPNAKISMAYVPTVHHTEPTGALKESWFTDGKPGYIPNVRKAMSLVPAEAVGYFELAATLYLDTTNMDATPEGRALTRPQIELLASRTAALNECFY